MKLKKLLILILLPTLINAQESDGYTSEDYALFADSFLTFPELQSSQKLLIERLTEALMADRTPNTPYPSFLLSVLHAAQRELIAIKKEANVNNFLGKHYRPSEASIRAQELLKPEYKKNILFILAEFLLNNIDSYLTYCRYLILEQTVSTITTETLKLDISLPMQLQQFKKWYTSGSLKKKLESEIRLAQGQKEVNFKNLNILKRLQTYLNKEKTTIKDAINCIQSLKNPPSDIDESLAEEFFDAEDSTEERSPKQRYLDDNLSTLDLKKQNSLSDFPDFSIFGDDPNTFVQKALPAPEVSAPQTLYPSLKEKAIPLALGSIATATAGYILYKKVGPSCLINTTTNRVSNYLQSGAHKLGEFFTRFWSSQKL